MSALLVEVLAIFAERAERFGRRQTPTSRVWRRSWRYQRGERSLEAFDAARRRRLELVRRLRRLGLERPTWSPPPATPRPDLDARYRSAA